MKCKSNIFFWKTESIHNFFYYICKNCEKNDAKFPAEMQYYIFPVSWTILNIWVVLRIVLRRAIEVVFNTFDKKKMKWIVFPSCLSLPLVYLSPLFFPLYHSSFLLKSFVLKPFLQLKHFFYHWFVQIQLPLPLSNQLIFFHIWYLLRKQSLFHLPLSNQRIVFQI